MVYLCCLCNDIFSFSVEVVPHRNMGEKMSFKICGGNALIGDRRFTEAHSAVSANC